MGKYFNTMSTTQMIKIMSRHGRSSRFFWTEPLRISFDKIIIGKTIWESSFQDTVGKSSKLTLTFGESRKRTVLVCACGRHKADWKDTKYCSNLKNVSERSRLSRIKNIFSSCLFGLHSTRMRSEQRYCENYRDMNESRISAGVTQSCIVQEGLTHIFPQNFMISMKMQKNVWSDATIWRTKQVSDYTKS